MRSDAHVVGMTQDSVDSALLRWEASQHVAITGDPLWRLDCYREALFLADLVRDDVKAIGLANSSVTAREQLLTAVGSIAANIAESYGRLTVADRARFISYAL